MHFQLLLQVNASATYYLQCDEVAMTSLSAVVATSAGADSFWISVDDYDVYAWVLNDTSLRDGSFRVDNANMEWQLGVGNHTVTIYGRHTGVQFAAFGLNLFSSCYWYTPDYDGTRTLLLAWLHTP